ncbi:bifunctional riboflavin kinase/FMN adenylyltransferase, partial [Candidatus Peregrinibacteria bacterium]|nr:bifunctional riboflavin kinase/FMN adenylyltransferase [Candidatus Peregrinibacteria bacterium]
VHIGPKPTLSDPKKGVEAFLLDFSGIVKPKTIIQINLMEKIRDIKKFENLEELSKAIKKDVDFVRSWYNSSQK